MTCRQPGVPNKDLPVTPRAGSVYLSITCHSLLFKRTNPDKEAQTLRQRSMDELYQTVPEQIEPIRASVQGSLPHWLKGSLLRNGPGMYEIGKETYRHWFDGLAMLHNYTISNGEVTYCSRYLQSEAHTQAVARKSIVYAEFGTPVPQDPCKNIFHRFFSYFVPPERTDNCSVSVFLKEGRAYANSDSPFLVQFDPSSLQSLSTYNARKDFPGETHGWIVLDTLFDEAQRNILCISCFLMS